MQKTRTHLFSKRKTNIHKYIIFSPGSSSVLAWRKESQLAVSQSHTFSYDITSSHYGLYFPLKLGNNQGSLSSSLSSQFFCNGSNESCLFRQEKFFRQKKFSLTRRVRVYDAKEAAGSTPGGRRRTEEQKRKQLFMSLTTLHGSFTSTVYCVMASEGCLPPLFPHRSPKNFFS
jgi:hypothetical protein